MSQNNSRDATAVLHVRDACGEYCAATADLKHAARLRAAALYAFKTGAYKKTEFFRNSRQSAQASSESRRLGDLAERYMQLKAVDITEETESRYQFALDACLNTIGETVWPIR